LCSSSAFAFSFDLDPWRLLWSREHHDMALFIGSNPYASFVSITLSIALDEGVEHLLLSELKYEDVEW